MHALKDVAAPRLARKAGLVYVTDAMPGIRRTRNGDMFVYRAPSGRALSSPRTLARLASLAVPPAYEDVWICPLANGHLQATGRDARGRKQYRYHPRWRAVRDDVKFLRMIDFGRALPKLRRRIARDLAREGLPRDKVVATVVALLDATRIRIGNAEYARDNGSFGLTTLRNRHARFAGGKLVLAFRGKGGASHEVEVDDRRLARLVRRCQELPGQRLFQYIGDDGARHSIDSDAVNDYLREAMGADFTAKDFRTWGATLHAIGLLARTPLPERPSESALKSSITAVIRQVAQDLRNTPAVCRKSYVNPDVFTAWRDGSLHRIAGATSTAAPRRAETLAIALLETCARGRATPAAVKSSLAHRHVGRGRPSRNASSGAHATA
jgi:DNA topoisomerase IB